MGPENYEKIPPRAELLKRRRTFIICVGLMVAILAVFVLLLSRCSVDQLIPTAYLSSLAEAERGASSSGSFGGDASGPSSSGVQNTPSSETSTADSISDEPENSSDPASPSDEENTGNSESSVQNETGDPATPESSLEETGNTESQEDESVEPTPSRKKTSRLNRHHPPSIIREKPFPGGLFLRFCGYQSKRSKSSICWHCRQMLSFLQGDHQICYTVQASRMDDRVFIQALLLLDKETF